MPLAEYKPDELVYGVPASDFFATGTIQNPIKTELTELNCLGVLGE